MKRRTILQSAMSSVALMASPISPARYKTVLTATDVHVSDYPTVAAVRWIGAELARATAGRLSIHMYDSGQLGRETDQVDLARFGAIDITRVYSGALNNAFPRTIALGLPYVFDSTAHLRRAIDSEIGVHILQGFARRGLRGLAIYDCGARCIYNTRGPIITPADLSGRKLRVPPSDVFMQLIRALGANPTPLPYGDVFSGMQTHLIDGAENNWKSFHSSRRFEVAKFWSQTEHSYAPDILLMSERRFAALEKNDQDLLLTLSAASVGVMRSAWDEAERAARAAVIAAGVAVNEVDLQAFQAAAKPVRDHYGAEPEIAAILPRIRALA
jgi:tripartite ATP-independent transporter DctP family solute receptor